MFSVALKRKSNNCISRFSNLFVQNEEFKFMFVQLRELLLFILCTSPMHSYVHYGNRYSQRHDCSLILDELSSENFNLPELAL